MLTTLQDCQCKTLQGHHNCLIDRQPRVTCPEPKGSAPQQWVLVQVFAGRLSVAQGGRGAVAVGLYFSTL
jgi:hypothetical protein